MLHCTDNLHLLIHPTLTHSTNLLSKAVAGVQFEVNYNALVF